ncbi:MAG: hypothetical protein NTW86_14190 [Candidatus Sumerlaeota bacterium]|nr:hypothetical protein [Candidatus Sumerlaeota bacterium]
MLQAALLACVATLAFAGRASAAVATMENFPFHKGMVLGLFHEDPNISYESALDEIIALGCDSVSLAVVIFEDDYNSSFLYEKTGRTAPDFRIRETVNLARARGLRVMLFPYVLLTAASEGKWRGALDPKDPGMWWQSYTSHLLRFAKIAQDCGAESLSIGSELASMEKYDREWRALIHEIRNTYGGMLTYTANWDHRDLTFWDELDYLSMSSYFELTKKPNPTLDDLTQGWKPFYDDIVSWYQRTAKGRPLVMAEVGYTSQQGTSQYPWDYTRDVPVNLEEQKLCYEAFRKVWDGAPFIRGVYFYCWFEEGGPNDAHYTPRGKPALDVVKDWFLPKQ